MWKISPLSLQVFILKSNQTINELKRLNTWNLYISWIFCIIPFIKLIENVNCSTIYFANISVHKEVYELIMTFWFLNVYLIATKPQNCYKFFVNTFLFFEAQQPCYTQCNVCGQNTKTLFHVHFVTISIS